MTSPIEVLREAIRAVPAVRYALGVAGILAAVALIGGFGLDAKTTVFGALGMLMLMVVLVVFARLTKTAPRHFVLPILVLMWSVLLITVASAALLFTAGFFDWPRPLSEILSEPEQQEPTQKPEADPAEARVPSVVPPEQTPEPAPPPESTGQPMVPPGPSIAVARAIPVARSQREAGDFAGAWETLAAVAGTEGGPELEREQAQLAMAWLREGRPGPGRTFTQLVKPLLPALHRAAIADEGTLGADALAHIGWGHFLESRDGTGGIEVEPLYEQAIARDPNNPYAHAMWGHLILWRSGDPAVADAHFAKALESGREGAWVRGMALSANLNRDALGRAARVLISMYEAGDTVDAEQRARFASRLYSRKDPEAWRDLTSSVDARAHLAMFKWLTTAEDLASSLVLGYRRAQLEAAAGECAEAAESYQLVRGRGFAWVSDADLLEESTACKARVP